MDEPVPAAPHSPVPGGEGGRCRYCGAALNPQYYFCTVCATPYKEEESVLPLVRPQRPGTALLIAKKAPHVASVFWTYLAVVTGSSLVCYLLFRDDHPGLQLLFGSAALLVTTCILGAQHWPSLLVQARRFGLGRPAALIGLLALVPMLAINYGYHAWLVHEAGLDYSEPLSRLRESGMSEAALVFFVCLLPALIEEVAFRGLVQHWLHVAVSPALAIVLASALFTVLHFSVFSAPYLFALGVVLGWVRWRTGSLYTCILIHFMHNLVVLELF